MHQFKDTSNFQIILFLKFILIVPPTYENIVTDFLNKLTRYVRIISQMQEMEIVQRTYL